MNWQSDVEFRGEDFTATVTVGNPDVLVGSGTSSVWLCGPSRRHLIQHRCSPPAGIVVAHYLQSVTPALALGGELVYHRRPGEEGSVTSLVGRYTGVFQLLPHDCVCESVCESV